MRFKNILLMVGLASSLETFSQTNSNLNMANSMNSKSIVFIHGLFLNNKSWENWETFFTNKGYKTYAPSYLGHEGDPTNLRNNAPENLGKVNFTDVLEHYESFIKNLDEKPILVGHSMGGLIAQKLIEKGLAEGAVIVSSAPPKGVITTKFSFLKSNLGLLNPFKGNSVFHPNKKWFHYAFTNNLSREESDKIFEQYVVPESRNIARETLKKAGKINFKKAHAPMLFIAGKEDHILPYSLTKKNFKRYKDKNSIRECKIYEGKDHFLLGENSWKSVANYIYEWIRK